MSRVILRGSFDHLKTYCTTYKYNVYGSTYYYGYWNQANVLLNTVSNKYNVLLSQSLSNFTPRCQINHQSRKKELTEYKNFKCKSTYCLNNNQQDIPYKNRNIQCTNNTGEEKDTNSKDKCTMKKMNEQKENFFTIPNVLCITRILCAPIIVTYIMNSNYCSAFQILSFAAVTDLIDGWIARIWPSQRTRIGSFLDPLADKILVGSLYFALSWVHLIPTVLTALVLSKDALLIIGVSIMRYMSLPKPRTVKNYFDVTRTAAQIKPTFISKVNTGIQLFLVASTVPAPLFHYVDHPALHALWYLTGVTTIAAGLSYIVTKDRYKQGE